MDKEFYIERRVSPDKVFRMQRAAKRRLQELGNKVEELCRDWQQDLCMVKALEENTSAAAQIKKMANKEAQRKTNQAIKAAASPKKAKSISTIEMCLIIERTATV